MCDACYEAAIEDNDALEVEIGALRDDLQAAQEMRDYWQGQATRAAEALGDISAECQGAEFEREGRWAVYADVIEDVIRDWEEGRDG